ncbi:MAG: hypothetical protein R3C11_24895 [Planctomycetaceae bacterium]
MLQRIPGLRHFRQNPRVYTNRLPSKRTEWFVEPLDHCRPTFNRLGECHSVFSNAEVNLIPDALRKPCRKTTADGRRWVAFNSWLSPFELYY